jgi:hypothetical protein
MKILAHSDIQEPLHAGTRPRTEAKKCQAACSCEQETESEEPSTRKGQDAERWAAPWHFFWLSQKTEKEETLAAALLVKADEQQNPNKAARGKSDSHTKIARQTEK